MEEPEVTQTSEARAHGDPERDLATALARAREECLRLEEGREQSRSLVHALNNALSIVSAFASVLSDEVEAGHPARESVEEILSATRRAGTLTRALGDTLRGAGKREQGEGRPRQDPA